MMKDGNGFRKSQTLVANEQAVTDRLAHPAWRTFVRYCAELQYGEIAVLKIQDGLPVLAEVVKKKVKFAS